MPNPPNIFDQFDQPAPPPFGGRPVIRRVDTPKTPAPQTAAQAALDVRQVTNADLQGQMTQLQIAEQQRKQAEAQQQRAAIDAERGGAVKEMLNVIDAAANAHRASRNGWLATGFGSDITGHIPGTPARDVKGFIDTISSNTAFDRLQKMRNSSPTGGALGAISERELDLLRSTIASPDPGQSDARFQTNMKTILDTYAHTLAKLPGGKEAYANWRKQWLKGSQPAAQGGKPAPKLPPGWSVEVR